ncbi:MAG TPA: hypothetical protein VJY41_08655 [Prolixibacteraceae bacterium]|nr:hypothetical protein [Prolixibacteraceae bacterium]
MKNSLFKYLGYLQIFVGMGALAGGLPMILNPEGAPGFSIELLQNSPFENYLIPGFILLVVNGLGQLISSYFSLKVKKEAAVLGIIFGAALMIWIAVQMYYISLSSWMQPLFFAVGMVELVLSIRIYQHNRIKPHH